MADCSKFEVLNQLLRLWYHENCRVFQDRLVNTEDREWFSGFLEEKIVKDFGCNIEEVNPRQPLLYGDFMIANVDNKVYAEVPDQEKVSVWDTIQVDSLGNCLSWDSVHSGGNISKPIQAQLPYDGN